MPLSSHDKLSVVMDFIVRMAPRPGRILDVGVGWGLFGMLCRAHLDLVDREHYRKKDWQCEIVGVEVFEGYRNPIWDFAYDEVLIGDATEVVPGLGSFDLVLLCDVLEHLPKEKGRAFLAEVLSRSRCAIVSSPRGWSEQESIYGNEAERHVSAWSKRDLREYHHAYRRSGRGFVAMVSREPLPKGVTRASKAWIRFKRSLIRTGPGWLYRFYRNVRARVKRSNG